MLILTRKEGERIQIGDKITVVVKRIKKGPYGIPRVELAFEAPREIAIYRKEILDRESAA